MEGNSYLVDQQANLFAYQISISLIPKKLTLISHPQLVLINFLQSDAMEFRLVNCFEKFTKQLTPIFLEANIVNHHCYLNESSAIPMDQLIDLLKIRFQRLLKISTLIEPSFASSKLLLGNQSYPMHLQKTRKRKIWNDYITIDEMTMLKSKTDPFSLKAIGKPKLVRHFTFKGQQRYPSTLLS